MNYNFFLLVANDATGSSPEQLDQYYEEMIKERLKNCKNPLVTETVIEQFRKNILKRLFVEELNLTLTPPIVFSSHLIAEKYIKVAFSGFKVIILVDVIENKSVIYKGPGVETAKRLLLPNFFGMCTAIFKQPKLCVGEIIDKRADYSHLSIKNEQYVN